MPPKYLSAFFSKQYLDTIGPLSHVSSHNNYNYAISVGLLSLDSTVES